MATREYLTNATVTMTDRGSEFLARKHGFVDLAHLQDWLPLEAHVLDIGAGYSPFGADVAKERPDIQWTNVDITIFLPIINRSSSLLQTTLPLNKVMRPCLRDYTVGER